jgi:hypothetical protein
MFDGDVSMNEEPKEKAGGRCFMTIRSAYSRISNGPGTRNINPNKWALGGRSAAAKP